MRAINNIIRKAKYDLIKKQDEFVESAVNQFIEYLKEFGKNNLYFSDETFNTNSSRNFFDCEYSFSKFKTYQKIFKNKLYFSAEPDLCRREKFKHNKKYEVLINDLDDGSLLHYSKFGLSLTPKPGVYIQKLDSSTIMSLIVTKDNVRWHDADGRRQFDVDIRVTEYIIGKNYKKWVRKISALEKKYRAKYKKLIEVDGKKDNLVVIYDKYPGPGKTTVAQPIENIVNPNMNEIVETVNTFIRNKDIYKEINVPYKIGILLYGPSGTGKTSVAKSLALKFNRDVVCIDASNINPNDANTIGYPRRRDVIVLIDEIDAQLMPDVSDVSNEKKVRTNLLLNLISFIDNLNNGEIVIATTNHIENLDSKVIRSGRFDCKYEFTDIGYDDCVKLVHSRGIEDADAILEGKEFPYNPSTLEQDCVKYLIKSHNLNVKDKSDLEDMCDDENDKKLLKQIKRNTKQRLPYRYRNVGPFPTNSYTSYDDDDCDD